jgi:hypothetical protein
MLLSGIIIMPSCLQKLDLKVKEKQSNWQNFISGKGSKKKAGFFGMKKESIFAVGALDAHDQ